MRQTIPHSPFSTRLSGSAKETELRLRNIFQWKKKRPPVPLFLAAILLVASCGGLIGFSTQTPDALEQDDHLEVKSTEMNHSEVSDHETAPEEVNHSEISDQETGRLRITMEVQYYDDLGRVVEIPRLSVPADWTEDTAAIDSINAVMEQLKREHWETVTSPLSTIGTACRLYPTETDRYVNLVLYYDYWGSSGNDGGVVTQVYDKRENRLVTIAEALELAGLTEAELLSRLEHEYDLQLQARQGPVPLSAQDAALIGFRIRNDGQPEFYLTVISDDPPGEPEVMDGWQHLFLWSQGSFTHYNCRALPENLVPLVPPEETMALDAPLWCQWYFSGGEPEDGFTPVLAALQEENTAMEAYRAVLLGQAEFVNVDRNGDQRSRNIHQLNENELSDSSYALKVSKFAVVDLDYDGISEVILWLCAVPDGLSEPPVPDLCFGFEVLHYQNGVVYDYTLMPRELISLKTDGTFAYSFGAYQYGFGTVQFPENHWQFDELGVCVPNSYVTDGLYFVNHESATEEELTAAYEIQDSKEDAVWYDFTDANIEAILQ